MTAAADQPFIHLSATPAQAAGEAPGFDQHTDEILSELGLSADSVAAIKRAAANRARG